MAGLGRKTFTAGEVLTAANVQGYLMDQTVMVFSSASARSAAIASPSDGMFAYLSDTQGLFYYNGSASAWTAFTAGGGAGLQDVFFLMGA
jgi:hypothetical protein